MHLFYKCRFTVRLWKLVIDKLGLVHLDTSTWHLEESVKNWWAKRSDMSNPDRKAMASLTMLVSWTVLNERNSRVFCLKGAPPPVLLRIILDKANLWVTAVAKYLGKIVLHE